MYVYMYVSVTCLIYGCVCVCVWCVCVRFLTSNSLFQIAELLPQKILKLSIAFGNNAR